MNVLTFRPKKSLGQNFLVDENIARKIIKFVAPSPEDIVIEIGPGFGVLTKYLIPEVKKIVAVEIDRHLVRELESGFGQHENFELVAGDFLEFEIAAVAAGGRTVRVLGNVPYHITSPVIFKIFDQRVFVRDMILMIQKEVARRIVAAPNSKDYGILSIFSQLYAEPRILFHVSKNVFKPRPEVDSSVVQWDFSKKKGAGIRNEDILRQVVRGTFQQRRKMLRKSLSHLATLPVDTDRLEMNLERRPEELYPPEFVELSNQIAEQYG